MARVALRTLTREIEDQIEHGQIDQAIANCRHILTYFPKHVDTYRLLGKAYMEGQRFGDAADVFQRVLSSVPDDFIAHLGMSIIQEDEGNLDDAIWHMERAFEMQPSNSAVQGELRRLYGRRDGLEPPKVRLTRGALARMYVKGGLYPQAISELRAALAEEAQRPDLLTLLAKAYHSSGQRVEAADTCSSLLSRLPYSLEGNRLLAEILSGSDRANEAETYRQRVQALDPYSAHVSASTPNSENVPDGAVTLERLEWKSGQPAGEAPSQPEWAASLGVKVAGLTPENESLPDWLASVSGREEEAASSVAGEFGDTSSAQPSQEGEEQSGRSDSTSGLAESLGGALSEAGGLGAAGLGVIGLGAAGLAASGQNKEQDEEIPDWMREAGWEASTGTVTEGSVSDSPGEPWADEQAQGEELAPADIPDWLRSMAPSSEIENVNQMDTTPDLPLPGEESGLPDDFAAGTSTPGDVLPWLSENPPGATDSVVTWLENKEAEPEEPGGLAAGESDSGAVEIPEWLRDVEEVSPESGASSPESTENPPDLPEWLATSPVEGGAEEIPDWLKGMVESSEQPVEQIGEQVAPSTEMEAAPSEVPVEWQPESAEEAPAVTGEGGEISGEVAAIAWLAGLEARQGEEADSSANPEEQPETPSGWVTEPAEAAVEPATPVERDLPVGSFLPDRTEAPGEGIAELPDWLQTSPDQMEEAGSVEGQEDLGEEQPLAASELPDWLRGLETGPGESQGEAALGWEEEEETVSQPSEPEGLLEWLNEAAEPPTSQVKAPSGLASLEEPPVAEEDTKPTRISKASEVAIPAVLAGFVAGAAASLSKEKESPSPEEMQVEDVIPSETVEQPEAVEATEAEPVEELLQVLEEDQPVEAEEEQSAGEAGLVTEALVPGVAAAAFIAGQAQAETLEESGQDETGPEVTASEQPESPGLPDWLRQLEEEPETPWEPSAWAAEETGGPVHTEPMGEAEPLMEDEAFAWLEGLAARQGAEEGLLVSPAERQEAPPEWVAAESSGQYEEQFDQPEVEPEAVTLPEPLAEAGDKSVSETEPAEQKDVTDTGTAGILKTTAAAAAAFTVYQDLSKTPEETVPEEPVEEVEAAVESEPTPEPVQDEIPAEKIPELPSWLMGYEQASAEEELSWMPPDTSPTISEALEGELSAEESAGPPERLDLNLATLIELERIPGIGFVRAQALVSYRETHGLFTSLEDLQNVPGFDTDTLALIQERVMVGTPAGLQEMPVDDHQLALIQSRNALAQGDRDLALDSYSSLIKRRALLPEVIQDLHEALYRFPVDVSIWQALGDAYARSDQLQEALDAYTKAEELLR